MRLGARGGRVHVVMGDGTPDRMTPRGGAHGKGNPGGMGVCAQDGNHNLGGT